MSHLGRFQSLLNQLADEHLQLHGENIRLAQQFQEKVQESTFSAASTRTIASGEVNGSLPAALPAHLSCKLSEHEPKQPRPPRFHDDADYVDSLVLPAEKTLEALDRTAEMRGFDEVSAVRNMSKSPRDGGPDSLTRTTSKEQLLISEVSQPSSRTRELRSRPRELRLPQMGYTRSMPPAETYGMRSPRGRQMSPESSPCSPRSVAGRQMLPEAYAEEPFGLMLSRRSTTLASFGLPAPEGPVAKPTLRSNLRFILRHERCDFFMGCLILLNSIMIAIESSSRLHGEDTEVYGLLEHVFLTIYVVEVGLRIFSFGPQCLQSGWIRFDLFMVLLGVLCTWLLTPALSLSTQDGNTEASDWILQPVQTLRVFRLFRLARALRLLVRFRSLWMLVQGLIHSRYTIMYTLFLVTMLLFLFSCISIELITIPFVDEPGPFGDIVREYWTDIPTSMLTLIRFVILDSIGSIYEPMIKQRTYIAFFFIPFMLLVSVTLMNLVTAVIVEGALAQSHQDKEAQVSYRKHKLQKLIPHLRVLFEELDADHSGTVTLAELDKAPESVREELLASMGASNLSALFEMIDTDGSGEVTVDGFCEGLATLTLADSPNDLSMIMLKQLGMIQRSLGVVQKHIRSAEDAQDSGKRGGAAPPEIRLFPPGLGA